jgi:filamentous hemagglutinin
VGAHLGEALGPFVRNGAEIVEGASSFKVTGEVSRLFATPEKALEHFIKHGSKVAKALEDASYNFYKYMADANHIIINGTYVSEKNAYVRLIGGAGEKAKYGFVGLDRQTGVITTFHIKYVDELIREAPSLGLSK